MTAERQSPFQILAFKCFPGFQRYPGSDLGKRSLVRTTLGPREEAEDVHGFGGK